MQATSHEGSPAAVDWRTGAAALLLSLHVAIIMPCCQGKPATAADYPPAQITAGQAVFNNNCGALVTAQVCSIFQSSHDRSPLLSTAHLLTSQSSCTGCAITMLLTTYFPPALCCIKLCLNTHRAHLAEVHVAIWCSGVPHGRPEHHRVREDAGEGVPDRVP